MSDALTYLGEQVALLCERAAEIQEAHDATGTAMRLDEDGEVMTYARLARDADNWRHIARERNKTIAELIGELAKVKQDLKRTEVMLRETQRANEVLILAVGRPVE